MITANDLILDGHPLLRTVIDDVSLPLSEEDQQLMEEMLTYLKHSQDQELAAKHNLKEGVGLAAPQIGLNKRIIAVYSEDEKGLLHEYALANPKIISHSEELAYLANGEGCLSVPEVIAGYVPRYRRLTVEGYTVDSQKVQIKVKDFIAIVFQHEIDHLNGKMFYDHINQDAPLEAIEGAHVIG